MIDSDLQEAIRIIEVLNDKIDESFAPDYDECELHHFELSTNGCLFYIKFMGYPIYSTENDERETIEFINDNGNPDEDYEDLEVYLRRTAKNIISTYIKINEVL